MSTIALSGSEPATSGRGSLVLRYFDIVVLALALPVFVLASLPMVGYGVCAAVWLIQRGIQFAAERRAEASLEAGNRRGAMGVVAATTIGRVWLVALTILLVGKIGEREDGLAAAVLTLLLVTTYFIGLGITKLLEPEQQAPAKGKVTT